ncbi:MAG: DUF1624 domain-containing protein [Candidatus Peregrinibacteria bacterium]|nr:DUF1624 domain-containing protein [Candidatus Peregrinibacteria bacterium]
MRIWELDVLRGIAIVMMVFFHIIFDLNVFFGFEQLHYNEGLLFYLGRIAAILFIGLIGVASSLIHKRHSDLQASAKNARRGLRLIGLGLIITAITWFFARENTIWFGILHFLGLSILIVDPLVRYTKLNVILAIPLLLAYYPMTYLWEGSYLTLIFGTVPASFQSYDYYALIPWLGYVLLGIALGNWLYKDGKPLIKRSPTLPEKALAWTGRKSLWIYMIHQPVLLGILYFLDGPLGMLS